MSQLAWRNPARMMDSASTVLPSGSGPVVVDSVVVQNHDRILFTQLSDPLKNNRIFKPNNIGVSVNWVLEKDGYDAVKAEFHGDPSDGEILYVREGAIHKDKIFAFRSESNTWDNILQGASDIVAIHRDNSQPPSTNISWNNFKLMDLANATLANDAINKGQLDAAIASVSMAADPNAIRKNNTNPPITDISWAGFRLINLGNGLVAGDAVNKSQLDLKADLSYVNSQNAAQDLVIAAKANTSYVDSQNAAQDAVIALKADKTYVDSQNAAQDAVIALKADKTYVDAQDTLKANITYVDSQNAAQDAVIALKADKTYVDFQNAAQDAQIAIRLRTDGGNQMAGDLKWSSDNLFDIGASGVNRPRSGYFGTSLVVGNSFTITSNSVAGDETSHLTIKSKPSSTAPYFFKVLPSDTTGRSERIRVGKIDLVYGEAGTGGFFDNDGFGIMNNVNGQPIAELTIGGGTIRFRGSDVLIHEGLRVIGFVNLSGGHMNLAPKTTAQRDAFGATAGAIVFNSTVGKHQGFDGTNWNDMY